MVDLFNPCNHFTAYFIDYSETSSSAIPSCIPIVRKRVNLVNMRENSFDRIHARQCGPRSIVPFDLPPSRLILTLSIFLILSKVRNECHIWDKLEKKTAKLKQKAWEFWMELDEGGSERTNAAKINVVKDTLNKFINASD